MTKRKIVHDYIIPDNFWIFIKSLLPLPKPKKKSGRPRKDDRLILSGIFYLLHTGCQWKSLPRFYGAPSTVHDQYQELERAGFFENMWIVALQEYNMEKGLDGNDKQLMVL